MVIVSNFENPEWIEKSKELGARDYLIRPTFTHEALTDKIVSFL